MKKESYVNPDNFESKLKDSLKPSELTGTEKLIKKWSCILNGLRSSNDTLINTTSSNNLNLNLNTGTGFQNNWQHIPQTSTPLNSINNTIVPGNGITNSYYDYTNYETLLNEHILNIDISKKTVDFYDFTKKITQYILKRFKTITIKNEEYDVISVERDLKPGELIQIKEYLDGEILVEFCEEDLVDRYGRQYVVNTFKFSSINNENIQIPLVRRVMSNLIGNELVTVQPLPAPIGLLNYMDFTYNGNLNNTYTTNFDNPVTTISQSNNITINNIYE